MKYKFIFSTLILFTLFFHNVNSQLNIGISPGFIDLGEVERGSTRIVSFYLVSGSGQDLVVGMSATKGTENVFNKEEYKDKYFNYSREDPSDWVEFIHNPVLIKPNESSIPGRPSIRGWKEVNFILKIPEDTEPGYHTLEIFFDPRAPPNYRGPFVIKATIPLNVIFKIPDLAIRQGKILDITKGGYVNDKLELNIFFQNTGTTTMLAHCDVVRIFKDDKEIAVLPSMFNTLKPNEVKTFKAYWDTKEVDFGNYNVSAEISYITGSAYKKTEINLYEMPPTAHVVEEYEFPWWWITVVIFIAFISYLVYRWYSE